jgi:hypothetical protein
LRRQFPDYLIELEVRFVTQSTLHYEMTRYQSLFDEGLISKEVYEDLKRNTLGAAGSSSLRRPYFDLGLDPHQLVKLDLLASLDERQLEIVCGFLRFRVFEKNRRWCGAIFLAAVPETFAMVGRSTDTRIVAVDGAMRGTRPCGRVDGR